MILCDNCSPRLSCSVYRNGDTRTECEFYQPMTEQEYLQSCNTEQLAEFLNLIIRVGPYENEPKDFWEHVYGRGGEHGAKSIVEWLKQPHKEN